MWADAQRDGRPAEYRWRPLRKLFNSIPRTTPEVWLTPAAGVLCSNAANVEERKVNFGPGKIPSGARAPENVYSVAAQETAKHRAKFGWPSVSDVAAVTKPRRKTR